MNETGIKLFLSVDIAGSTKLKNSQNYSNILNLCNEYDGFIDTLAKEELLEQKVDINIEDIYRYLCGNPLYRDWSVVIKRTFNDFDIMFRGLNQADEALDSKIFLWKAAGDELIYCIDVDNQTEVYYFILKFYKTLRTFDKKLSKSKTIRLKGTAWSAGFPVRNRIIKMPFQTLYYKDGEADYKEYPFPKNDFLGPEIDIGFRLGKCSSPGIIVISLELAYILTDNSIEKETGEQFRILNVAWENLKGVWDDNKYPIFWLKMPESCEKVSPYSYDIYKTWDKEANPMVKKYAESCERDYCDQKYISNIIEELPDNLSVIKPYFPYETEKIDELHKKLKPFIDKIKEIERELNQIDSKEIKKEEECNISTNAELAQEKINQINIERN